MQLLQDVRSYKKRLISEEGHVDIVVLATHLAAIGYRVAVRTALGGGTGQECFHNLHYEFLLVTDEHSILELIVDPRFRQALLTLVTALCQRCKCTIPTLAFITTLRTNERQANL